MEKGGRAIPKSCSSRADARSYHIVLRACMLVVGVYAVPGLALACVRGLSGLALARGQECEEYRDPCPRAWSGVVWRGLEWSGMV